MMLKTDLSRSQVAGYVGKFASTRVGVLGDVMLDRYFWGEVDRISPEAPVPIVKVRRRSSRLGGAANVAANLREYGCQVTLMGVVGDDRAGSEFTSLLESRDVNTEHIFVEKGHETTEKVRIIAQHQQVVRADFEEGEDAGTAYQTRFTEAVERLCAGFDALVVSDYGKGVLGESVLRDVIGICRKRNVPILVDPHVTHFRWYVGATLVTPNTREAASFYGATPKREDLFDTLGFKMREELELSALLITRGEDGMSLFLDGGERVDILAVAKNVYDVTGAGDTVISTLGAAVASGAPMVDAVVIANQAAGEAVKEVGTTTVTADALINAFK